MVRKLIILLFVGFCSANEPLEVSADRIFSDRNKGETVIRGNVLIRRGSDILRAKQVVIQTDSNQKPSKYTASGSVSFKIKTSNEKTIRGEAEILIYDAKKDQYQLLKKAYVQEVGKANAIKGEEIWLNRKDGSANVVGGKKKPAKIIFSLEPKDVH